MSRNEAFVQSARSQQYSLSTDATLRNSERSYKTLQEALADLSQIQDSVRSKTGWSVALDSVKVEVVSPSELHRRTERDHLRRTGVPTDESSPLIKRAFNTLNAMAYFHGVIAAYLPSEGTILINQERLRGASKDAIKSALHHEVTHLAQHQAHPKFIEALDNVAREYQLSSRHGADLPKDEQARRAEKFGNQVQARMSLLEGQAVALQRMFEDEQKLAPEIRMGAIDLILGLTHRFMVGMRHKLGQYMQGEEIFRCVHALGVKEVDELFKSPRYTDLVFGPDHAKTQAK